MNQNSICSHSRISNCQGFLGTPGRGLLISWEHGSFALLQCVIAQVGGLEAFYLPLEQGLLFFAPTYEIRGSMVPTVIVLFKLV